MYKDQTRFLLVCLFLFASMSGACTTGSVSEVQALKESDRVIPIDTIAIQETDQDYIGDFGDMRVVTNPFRMYVPDFQRHHVAVLNRQGEIEQYIGERGDGPGELQSPATVALAGDSIIVSQAQRRGYVVFDTTGQYRSHHGYPNEMTSLNAVFRIVETGQYVLSATGSETVRGGANTADQTTLAFVDSDFGIQKMFGRFPDLYLDGEYALRENPKDVEAHLLVVGYAHTPNVQVYDMQGQEPTLLETRELDHPAFKSPHKPIPLDLARSDMNRFVERLSQVSLTTRTYILPNKTVVQYFENRSLAYYENEHDPAEREDYAILADLNSDQQEALSLPGPILARDDANRIYVELDPTPDQRKIGVYEVVGWE